MGIIIDTIQDEIDSLIEVGPTVAAPAGDPGFGSDLWCLDDLSPNMDELAGDSLEAITQSNYRRLRTPRGGVCDDPDYGIDVASYLHEPLTRVRQKELEDDIQGELRKDDRNDSVTVTFTERGARAWDLNVSGETAAGPFSLTMALVDAEAILKEINGDGVS